MAQISQNPDGTYSKSYSDTELAMIRSMQTEIQERTEADQQLWLQITSAENRIDVLEDERINLSDLQAAITQNILRLDTHGERIDYLEKAVIVDAYSKRETDAQLIAWKVEEIPHVFDIPTNDMFQKADIDTIKAGYAHFYHADINEPHDHHIPENTMRRYTLNAYAATPKKATFQIHFADRCTVYVDDAPAATYIDSYGNFGGTAKVLSVDLKEGWTKIQFLIANETQQGGLIVKSDLYEQADYLSNLDVVNGMISGDRIQSGAIEARHMSPNMDLVVNTIHATATGIPAGVFGDPNGCGIIQIGDKTISKCKDEPFVIDDDIRVNGYIRVSQLLIDVDFIRAGKGIIVEAIKDAETGFTKMYEIINDMKIINGGGLIIVGNAQDGYTITNNMQIIGHPDGGIQVHGDAVNGYMIENIMKLTSLGGLSVSGNATHGFYVQNTMRLTASPGLKVEGNAYGPNGYNLKNQVEMVGDGIKTIPTIVDNDAYSKWLIVNDTNLETQCGGIGIDKLGNGHFRLTNKMQLKEYSSTGSVVVRGDACSGYTIEGKWPTITAGAGIRVDNNTPGSYSISNMGVLALQGSGATSTTNLGNGLWQVHSDRVNITGSGEANVSGWYPNFNVHVNSPPPPPDYNIVGMGDISAYKIGNTFYVSYSAPDAPPVVTPPYEPPPYEPPPTGGGGSRTPGTGSLSYSGNVSGGKLPKQASAGGTTVTSPVSITYSGLAGGMFTFNDDSSVTVNVTVRGGSSGVSGTAYVFAASTMAASQWKKYDGGQLSGTSTMSLSLTVSKAQVGSTVYIGVCCDLNTHRNHDVFISILQSGTFS